MLINENNYVDMAEEAIKKIKKPKTKNGKPLIDKNGKPKMEDIVTTSKIRNLLAMAADIYNDVNVSSKDHLSGDIVGKINYMKIRFYYEAGREESVKILFDEAKVFEIMKEIGDSKKNYILFNRYMEALVAFRKYYYKGDE